MQKRKWLNQLFLVSFLKEKLFSRISPTLTFDLLHVQPFSAVKLLSVTFNLFWAGKTNQWNVKWAGDIWNDFIYLFIYFFVTCHALFSKPSEVH